MAEQKCISELKEQLTLEFSSLQEQISETKGNFQNFLQEYSTRLSQDEMEGLLLVITSYDTSWFYIS